MRKGAKMLMIAESRSGNRVGGRGGSGGRSEMRSGMRNGMENGMEMGYGGMEMNEMEMRRRRDRRGRFRSEMENEMGGMENEMEMRRGGGSGGRSEMGYGGMEMRRGGGRGGSGGRNEMEGGYGRSEMGMESRGGYGRSEMESRGGYGRNEMEGRNEMRGGYGESEIRSEMRGYPNRPFPVYEGGGGMNQIGFNANPEIETNYRMNATHKTGNEMEYKSNPKMGGGYSSSMSMPMNKEMAEEWTSKMKNEDGTKGPHWKMEQVKQLMAQKGIEANPFEFFAILNAMYSDYCAVFKKHGVNTMDMYIDLACAFLNDSDAMPNKAALYYECIVKK